MVRFLGMVRASHHLFTRLLATVALLGYVSASAEQYVPDDHDWHAADAPAVVATGEVPPGPAEPAPGHPVHVCHGAHQHAVGPVATVTPLPAFVSEAWPPAAFDTDAPASPSSSTPLRPPII
mgnify:CR=1 FL=1